MKKSELRIGDDHVRGAKMSSEVTTPSETGINKANETKLKPLYVTCWTGTVPEGYRLVPLPLPVTHKDKEFAEGNKRARDELLRIAIFSGG